MNAKEALLKIRSIVEKFGDERTIHSFYLEFGRRLEVLKHVEEHCRRE